MKNATLLVAALLMFICMISSVSAADADSDSLAVEDDPSSDTVISVEGSDSSDLSQSESNGNSENEVLSTDNYDTPVAEESTVKNTSIKTDSDSVIRGYDYAVTLVDGDDQVIANKSIGFELSGKTYAVTTDSNGKAALQISLAAGSYTLKMTFEGDGDYSNTSKTIGLKVLANTPTITTGSTNVVRGHYLYAYLKDKAGNPMKGEKVTFKINGKTYVKTTNSKGRAALKITQSAGSYKTSIYHYASGIYSYAKKAVTVKALANTPKITISKSVIRGKNLYVYLKDRKGVELKNKKLSFRLNGRTYIKKTNADGRAALRVTLKNGKYSLRVSSVKNGVYQAASKSATVSVLKNTPKITVANTTVIKGKYLYVYLKDGAGSVMKKQKLSIKLNGKTYSRTTNSKGRAALKMSFTAKSYSTVVSFGEKSIYSARSLKKTVKVINDPSKNTLPNIEKAANSVKNYVNAHGRLPNTVKVGNERISIEEFSYLMSEAIIKINKGSSSRVGILNDIGDVSSSNDTLDVKVLKDQYVELANRIVSYTKTNHVPPAYAEVKDEHGADVGKASFDVYAYSFAKILAFNKEDGYLPNWCTFESDVFYTIAYDGDMSAGYVSSANKNQFKRGLNEKNTESNLAQYLVAKGHCELNAAIRAKAEQLTKGLTTTASKANAIFKYVRDGIAYSYYADSQKDAKGTYSSKSANCCDQANLVVALCRASGIPARYSHAQGCSFSSGLVTGHVWAQILVGDTWYTADATSSRNGLGNIQNWNTNSFNTLKTYAQIPF